jgi:hypothetical protein
MPSGHRIVQMTLAIAAILTLAYATVYAYVGMRLGRSHLRGDGKSVMAAFGIWWIATSINQYLGGAFYLAAAFGYTDFPLQLAYVIVQRLLLAVSMIGLMYYIVYLVSGRRILLPLAILYLCFWLMQIYVVFLGSPDGIDVYRWRTDLHYTATTPSIFSLIDLVVIVLPPVIGAALLLRLYKRVETPTQRFRIVAVSVGFIAWWLVAVLAGQRSVFDNDALQALNRIVGAAVGLLILLAYEPTGWMQRRYNLRPYASSQG